MKTYEVLIFQHGFSDDVCPSTLVKGVEEWRLTAQIALLAAQAAKDGIDCYSIAVNEEHPA